MSWKVREGLCWLDELRGKERFFFLPSLLRHHTHSFHSGGTSHRVAEPDPLACHRGQDGARRPWQTRAGDMLPFSNQSDPIESTNAHLFWITQNTENNYERFFLISSNFLAHIKVKVLKHFKYSIPSLNQSDKFTCFSIEAQTLMYASCYWQNQPTLFQNHTFTFLKICCAKNECQQMFPECIRVDKGTTNMATQCQTTLFFPAVSD